MRQEFMYHCLVVIEKERLAEMDFSPFNRPIENVIPSEAYLLRPFVDLKGQRNGYRFSGKSNDLWRSFLNANVKKFCPEITGNKCQSENAIANALFKGQCRVDSMKFKTSIGKFKYFLSFKMPDSSRNKLLNMFLENDLIERYFPTGKNVMHSISQRFAGCQANYVKVGFDTHESTFHAKFASRTNSNKHRFLINTEKGKISVNL